MNALDDFLLFLSSEKGASAHTIDAYGRDIRTFISSLESKDIHEVSAITKEHIYSYISSLQENAYAAASLYRKIIALKVFFTFCKREGYLQQDIGKHLQTPKLWQLIPDVLTETEIEKMINLPNPSTEQGARDRALLEVLYATGIRVSELCQLNVGSVDDTFVRVLGKGQKERVVPIGQKAILALDHYLGQYRHEQEDSHILPLFINQRGKRISRTEVWKLIKHYAKAAGITKNVHPHTLRHTFATHLLDHGADLRVIQEMLGHASISSTDRYTHISRSKLSEDFAKYHPRYTSV